MFIVTLDCIANRGSVSDQMLTPWCSQLMLLSCLDSARTASYASSPTLPQETAPGHKSYSGLLHLFFSSLPLQEKQ